MASPASQTPCPHVHAYPVSGGLIFRTLAFLGVFRFHCNDCAATLTNFDVMRFLLRIATAVVLIGTAILLVEYLNRRQPREGHLQVVPRVLFMRASAAIDREVKAECQCV